MVEYDVLSTIRRVGKFGRKPNDPSRPRLRLGPEVLKVTPPASVNFYSSIGGGGMLGNDVYGDCVFAANGHIVEQQTALGQAKEVTVTTAQVLAEYSKVTGFDPNDPSTDNGAEVQQGLDDLRKAGLNGHKIVAFAQIDVKDMNTVKNAVAEFGVVDIGFSVPNSAMNQFNAGQPWDVVANDGGIDGGHCVIVCGFDAKYVYVYTWNAVQKMTYAFWNKYVEEAWAVIDQDWVNAASGLDPDKVNLADLGAQWVALFPGQPNPFPAPIPTPTPVPTPTPTPTPVPPGPKPTWWDEFVAWLAHLFD